MTCLTNIKKSEKDDDQKALVKATMEIVKIEVSMNIEKAIKEGTSISELINGFQKGEVIVFTIISQLIKRLRDFYNFNNPITDIQIIEVTTRILSRYKGIKIEEVVLVCEKIKTNAYGKPYGLNAGFILECFSLYKKERLRTYKRSIAVKSLTEKRKKAYQDRQKEKELVLKYEKYNLSSLRDEWKRIRDKINSMIEEKKADITSYVDLIFELKTIEKIGNAKAKKENEKS